MNAKQNQRQALISLAAQHQKALNDIKATFDHLKETERRLVERSKHRELSKTEQAILAQVLNAKKLGQFVAQARISALTHTLSQLK